MKKVSYQQNARNTLLAKKRWQHNIKRLKLKQEKRRLLLLAAARGQDPREYIYRAYNIDAPAKFNLSDGYEDVISFLAELRRQSGIKRRRYSVNFKTIRSISPMGALVLTAEMDRWRIVKGIKLFPAELKKWDPEVRRLLNEMGFFEVLGIENPCTAEDTLEKDELKFIRFISGNVSDGTYAKQLRVALEGVVGNIDNKIFMYNGLVEAMSNSVEHAYPEKNSFRSTLANRWWISGSYNKSSGRMTVMAYDQGVGIPATLPTSPFATFVRRWLSAVKLSTTDANLIKAAMQIGKTQTELENRGLGLNEMKEFVKRYGRGTLRIISGKGDYVMYHNEQEKSMDHDKSLRGTLIAWEIYTDGEVEQP